MSAASQAKLEDSLLELRTLVAVCIDLAASDGRQGPTWPWLLGQHVDRLSDALQAHFEASRLGS